VEGWVLGRGKPYPYILIFRNGGDDCGTVPVFLVVVIWRVRKEE